MKSLFELIFFGHIHEFKTIKEDRVIDPNGCEGWRYIQQCEHCGELKKTTLI